jgi:hypothetical protein
MNQKDLHEIIIDLLKKSKAPLSIREIIEEIAKKKLWLRLKDSKIPSVSQVSARVSKYPQLFFRKNGVVALVKDEIEHKFTRLTYNKEGWIEPSGWERKSRTPGLHEAKHGFGHEEWLFDFNHLISGYKYGFIEGFRTKKNKHGGKIYNLQLFTIDSYEKRKYWAAQINNCYVLTEEEQLKIQQIYSDKGWIKEQENQLRKLKLWNIESKKSLDTFGPNIRFLESDVVFFDPLIPVPENKYLSNRNRYLLYDWIDEADLNLRVVSQFNFKASKPHANKEVLRNINPEFKSKEIKQLHRQIALALYAELSKKYGSRSIGCDLPCNPGTYIDMVRKDGDKYVFYEIKTYNQLKKNIREAFGQLLEYAYWTRNKTIKEIVIVSDKKIEKEASEYLSFIKKTFKIPISYMQQKI